MHITDSDFILTVTIISYIKLLTPFNYSVEVFHIFIARIQEFEVTCTVQDGTHVNILLSRSLNGRMRNAVGTRAIGECFLQLFRVLPNFHKTVYMTCGCYLAP